MSSPKAEIWERYAAKYKPRRATNAAGATTWLNWTQYPDHGPDETVLGELRGKRVLELGSGAGANLAHLATLGAVCTGVDIAPSRADLALKAWGHLGELDFISADAIDYLATAGESFDIVYSIFGAVWFSDPEELLPLVRKRMTAGGVLAFSHPPATQQDAKPGQVVQQRHLSNERWIEHLVAAGFHEIEAEIINAPEPGNPGTVLLRAHVA
ncbi:bifunctional 2-polyprenyl-6-hydroxyphenol methylase/3-demethylubiquinol 3-O-methyltransferase UbiG [Lentzea sp. HUAS12]|uniref:class I SAM-dependent methyltransferase n=1 Tax=Lentzea sp. HUAS12 TaxID=2951806 RepID=UPI0020A20D94|nr:class I SAM-dependent methyltransferase [Lentzea sp. HUAS12]USX51185.1 class I SAM-dependent methyltransferase [Lentzea sp. HUAS12]